MSGDLAAFVSARLDEDEAAAKAATPGPWILAEGREWLDKHVVFGEGSWPGHIQQVCNVDYAEHKEGNLAHIALHDPDRVLREVEAGRRLLARYEELQHPKTLLERATFPMLAEVVLACIRDRAAVYDYHPDFREEWKP